MIQKIKKSIGLAAASGLFLLAAAFPSMAQTNVHFLDVGQGLSVLIESQGRCALYDGGDSDRSSYVVSYLKSQGVETLDYVIASHYDSDHLNGVVGALNVFPTDQVLAPDYRSDTRVYNSFTEIIADRSIPFSHPVPGDSYALGDAVLQVLAPAGSDYEDVNDYSIILRIVDGETSFLLMGDAEAQSENELLVSGQEIASTVLQLSHHGSASSTSSELLSQISPEFAVLSCGDGNSHGHPHKETMEKVSALGIPLLRTDKQGAFIASSDGSSVAWSVTPGNDYSPGNNNAEKVPLPLPLPAPEKEQEEASFLPPSDGTYILNINTDKFHYPSCKSVKQMSEKNKRASDESRDALIAQGFSPCGNCHP